MKIEESRFVEYIQCNCRHCGGLVVDGIEIDYVHYDACVPPQALVFLSIVKRPDMCEGPLTFWGRIKLAWDIVRGQQDIDITDIVLDKKGMTKLRETCDFALTHWPSREELAEPRPTLQQLYEGKQKKEESK